MSPSASFEAADKAMIAAEHFPDIMAMIRRDYDNLYRVSEREKWYYGTVIPPHFFAAYASFDTERSIENCTNIVQVSPLITGRLVRMLKCYPELLSNLTSREFEVLIAEIFNEFGFDVDLTKQTRDGGFDIVAVTHHIVPIKYLIECKRYVKQKTVGVAPVRQLHGVTITEGANKGILVTTGKFTGPAERYLGKHPWLLEGRDFDGLTEWLRLYDKSIIERVVGK